MNMVRQAATQFLVEICYREPSYEARNGARAEPFRFRYRVNAHSEAAARKFAIEEFEYISARSSVGWVRDIVAVDVIPVIGIKPL